ncbi:hypothetical protein [Lacisediminihabitans profunda]|uniref:Uncharacterized protein n=1 Tax=Lacisediminihabitans profunda TaxID=2594790 RepID=A0A5C8UNE9_9MICO|nr:hypothetical protein [Lacisediminihabitans profunda]TXN28949.1 hypothetical protein FVP33_15615 [Lacisediminihabitans profunda]
MRTQPIAAREVANRLIELAEGSAVGRSRDLAGPQAEHLIELARAYADAAGLPGTIVSIPLPGVMGTAMRTGALLPDSTAQTGIATFAEWLNAQDLRNSSPRPPA